MKVANSVSECEFDTDACFVENRLLRLFFQQAEKYMSNITLCDPMENHIDKEAICIH